VPNDMNDLLAAWYRLLLFLSLFFMGSGIISGNRNRPLRPHRSALRCGDNLRHSTSAFDVHSTYWRGIFELHGARSRRRFSCNCSAASCGRLSWRDALPPGVNCLTCVILYVLKNGYIRGRITACVLEPRHESIKFATNMRILESPENQQE
jgi:hypothetical protein